MFHINDGMLFIQAPSVSEAWVTALQAVFFEGVPIKTQYDAPDDFPSKDVSSFISVTNPFSEPFSIKGKPRKIAGFDVYCHPADIYCIKSVEGGYLDEVMSGDRDHLIWERGEDQKSYPYTYHDRLYNYKPCNKEDLDLEGMPPVIDGNLVAFNPVNQIDEIVKQLKKAIYTRRAQAITWRPIADNLRPDPPCYDDQTEILTKEGWKLFKVLLDNDEVMTLNPENNEIVYQKPVKKISYHYTGSMYLFEGHNCNFSVTPNHNMLVYHRRTGKQLMVDAKDLPHEFYIKREGIWNGQNVDEFKLGDHKIPMNYWLRFLAIYLSDGSYTIDPKDSRYRIRITQKKHIELYREIINLVSTIIGFNVHEINDPHCEGAIQFTFHSKEINEYVSQFGRSKDHNRFIPDFIKSLSSDQIRVFLNSFQSGDSTTNGETIRYNSTSKRMVDDLQELVLKSGIMVGADIWSRNDKEYYELKESRRENGIFIAKKDIQTIKYDGDVYCVEVPNYNIIYVRRNGKPMWCGNCLQRIWARVFKCDDGVDRLRFNAHWRSRDLFGAWAANVNGMLQIAKAICDYLGVEMGQYNDYCDSLHTYGRVKLVYKEILPVLERIKERDGLLKPEYDERLGDLIAARDRLVQFRDGKE